ncbi:putative membrane protein [Rhizobium sp. BK650]|uniref:pilus assembly protein TadG-related protein n=1 Tax=Rhizobium sp. BK650 TaxID=2586990 RepID=UPI0016171497|nr:pilus assembly protein TadG-related protein [Rhizobium sp. BK650]MBB3656988.1 putative membrane protein [Rhizobium sp. BK650]
MSRFCAWPARFAVDAGGNIAITSALCAPLVLYTLGLGIDYGMMTLQQRRLQELSDLGAIVAASDINHAAQNLVTNFSQNGLNVAVKTANGYETKQGVKQLSGADLETFDAVANLVPGTYVADMSMALGSRFSPGIQPYDAARVDLSQKAELAFAAIFASAPTLSATGTASASKLVAFSIGSRLASLNDGVLNELLGSLLGTTISLKVADYTALAAANVELLSFLDTLATDLNLTAGSYDDVLATEISYPRLLTTLKKTRGLTSTTTKALDAIEKALGTTQVKLKLEDLLNLGTTGERLIGSGSHLSVDAGVMDILSAAAIAANQKKQVAVNLNTAIPGLAAAKLTLAIGEPPKEMASNAVGTTGTAVRTAQVRLAIEVNALGIGSIAGIKLRVPLYVEAAYAEAKLANVSCLGATAQNANVGIDVVPGVAELDLGDVDTSAFANFGSKPRVSRAKIIDATLLSVSALAEVNVTNQSKTRLTFQPQDIAAKTIKNVSTKDTLTSTVATLLANTDIQVTILGLGIGLPKSAIQGAVADTLAGLTKPLDELLFNTLTLLGIKIGEADVRVTDVRCQQSVLVQ